MRRILARTCLITFPKQRANVKTDKYAQKERKSVDGQFDEEYDDSHGNSNKEKQEWTDQLMETETLPAGIHLFVVIQAWILPAYTAVFSFDITQQCWSNKPK